MRRILVALAIASLPAVIAAQNSVANDRLNLDLYWEYETVSDPQLSPDGAQILYTRGWIDKINDKRESSLWIMNADGSRNRFLGRGSNARWSPSGDRIVYTAQGDPKGTQIFVRYMDAEGAVSQITHVNESPANVSWSPDGQSIAFAMKVEKKNVWSIKMPERPEGAKWVETPRIVERLDYRQDGQGFNDDGFRHLFTVPATGGTPRQLTNGDWDHNGVEWTPDGKQILFSSLRVADADYEFRESEIYSVNVDTGAIAQLTRRKGPDNNPRVSPDGKLVAYTGIDASRNTWTDSKLYVMNIDGSNPKLVSGEWDRSPQNIQWKADGTGIYFNAQDSGSQNLYVLPMAGVRSDVVQPVTKGTYMLTTTSVSKTGKAVGVLTSMHIPPDIVTYDVAKPELVKQLTAVNDDILKGKKLGAVKEMWYSAPDGLKIQGWYITPPDFDATKKYPMQLHIHGGPHSMYGVGFNYGWQEMAANGYVVLYTNPRGSTGYGSEFGNKINNAYPSKDYDDLMAGVDELLKKGFVDDRNMFVTGCSGGGVLTAWIVGKTDRFAAASANCPVVDWLSFVGTTDSAGWYYNFEKLPWDDPAEHFRRSPLSYVGNVKTPTMLITGVQDLRTPMPQTEQFYSALKLRKVPTAMIRMNNEWHGTSSTPSNFVRTQLYLRHWFDKVQTHACGHDDGCATTVTATFGERGLYMRRSISLLISLLAISISLTAQVPGVDNATINRIRGEAITASQAMDTHWWLSEGFGARATGTPGYTAAADWAMKKFNEWGFKNVHIERFPFGQGWSIDRFSAHLLTPQAAPLIGMPRWYSPSTNGTVTSDVVHLKAANEADLAKYKGQLVGKIVILQAARPVRMLEDRIVLRMNDKDWAEAMKLPEPRPAGAPGAQGAPGAMTPQQFAQLVQRFLVAEGAAVVLDRGSDADLSAGGSDLSWQTQRVDGGTIFPGNGGSRDASAPKQVPSATLAVEHYNRLVRLLEHGQPVRMEVNIQTKFHPETDPEGNAFNIIAEIPGSDLAGEVVIMGAHFDTYPYATGATDNTTGSAAMIEALRVIQKLGLKPRRTIRLALWAAEEQGLLGSRAYVARHFYDTKMKTPKPGHENVQAYFNLDNGTGRILGIWGQNNTGAMKNFEQWGQALKDIGWKNVSPRSVTQTDHGSFEEAGIPGFQFIQERLEYNSRTHHSNMDTFDHVQKDDVIQQGAVAAVFAWYAANTPEKLPRKPSPK